MLAALLIAGIAAVAAVPILMPPSEDAGDDVPPDAPTGTDLAEDPVAPEATGPGHDLLDSMFAPPPDILPDSAPVSGDAPAQGPDPEPVGPVLSPGAGDTPDIPPVDSVDTPVLGPQSGDTPDVPPVDTVDTPVLAPETGDAPETGSGSGVLSDFQIDAPAPLQADVPPMPSPTDITTPTGPADVPDFVSGEDILEVTIITSLEPDSVEIDIRPSGDGSDSVVTANEIVVAILRGAPDATPDDVLVAFETPEDGQASVSHG